MSGVIACTGQESVVKNYDGKEITITPFVGADGTGEFAQVGIGVINTAENSIEFWGLVCPKLLLNSWRAMKLFELLSSYNQSTLAHCWDVIREPDITKHKLYIMEQFESHEVYHDTINSIRVEVPAAEVLSNMLQVFIKHKIYVSARELIDELDGSIVNHSEEITELLIHKERERIKYMRREEILNAPTPKNQSLSVFFKQLGLGNFIIGGGFGAYGLDWGHIEIEELDRIVKQDSQYSQKGHYLEITTKGPDTHRNFRNFGVFKHPSYVDNDGTAYTFERARWSGDHFRVFTRIDETHKTKGKKRLVNEYVGEYTVDHLQQLLESGKKKRWWQI